MNQNIEWIFSKQIVDYQDALNFMQKRVEGISLGKERECIWFLEHNNLYTAGTSAKSSDLLDPNKFPVYEAGRGGEYTYHGPGQRIVYIMLDLKKRKKQDVRLFVSNLERIIINTIAHFNIQGFTREGRIGVWVNKNNQEVKIAALGIRLKRWVTYHGIAININPNLNNFSGIVPCGIKEYGVTSLADLGLNIDITKFDEFLKQEIISVFGDSFKN